MKILKYSFKDIRIYKTLYITILIQLIVTYIILSYALMQAENLYNGVSNLNDLAKSNSYVLVDSTSEAQIDKIFNNDVESKEKLGKIFKEIDKFDNFYINWKYDCELQNGYLGSALCVRIVVSEAK